MAIYQAVTGTTMVNVNNIATVSVSGNQVVLNTIDGKVIPLNFPNAASALNAYANLLATLNAAIPFGPQLSWIYPVGFAIGGGQNFVAGGFNLQTPCTVKINGVNTFVALLSSTGIQCTTNATPGGVYDVVYNGPNGNATLPQAATFT